MLDLLGQTTTYYVTSSSSSNSGMSGGLLAFILIASLVLAVISIVALWKVYEKAGEAGWKVLIPFYNIWVLLEISGKPGWWFLLSFIPFVGSFIYFVLFIIAMLELAKRFGKSAVFAIFGLVLFPFIGHLILAFGPAKYTGEVYRTFEA